MVEAAGGVFHKAVKSDTQVRHVYGSVRHRVLGFEGNRVTTYECSCCCCCCCWTRVGNLEGKVHGQSGRSSNTKQVLYHSCCWRSREMAFVHNTIPFLPIAAGGCGTRLWN